MHILTANVANSKNYKFIFMYYLLCFLPTLFTVLALNSTKRWLYMTNSIHFFYISREIWMPLICYNLMAFYLIWVGFSLKIIILIGEHCYADFCVKNKILNFSAKFFFCLWRHTVNHRRVNTTIKRLFSQAISMPSFISFEIICMSLWTDWVEKHSFLTIVIPTFLLLLFLSVLSW